MLAGLLVAGCSSSNPNFSPVPGPSAGAPMAVPNENQPATATPAQQPAQTPVTPPSHAVVTPDNSLSGKVVTYNSVGRFVVLRFPVGQLPKNGQALFVYRGGLKVGELKISGEQRDNFVVADIVNGEAQPGDDVRDQ